VQKLALSLPWTTEVCVAVTNMAERMVAADLAIGAVGTTAWERCCLGLPTIALVLADNQREGARHLELAGAVCLLPDHESMPQILREKLLQLQESGRLQVMQDACYQVTDGRGVQRLARRLLLPQNSFNKDAVRPMHDGDLLTVLTWRNHPSVKHFMWTSKDISQEEHRAWFRRVSQDATRSVWVFEKEGQPLGFVQFSKTFDESVAEWGFYVAPNSPKGTGYELGMSALQIAFVQLCVSKVIGNIMDHNEASIRFHRKLGFEQRKLNMVITNTVSFELSFEVWLKTLEIQYQGVK
jgi:UDP-4-amino-4,6-dideoxy-N-acetyl-beta-L-altrosamine N-acetyltransferase